ncbi:hypothetical protein MSTE_03560 [Mycobacteroides stephanolepidis]|uniref:Uncharacterized protein n=1 Tax=[Mycobacterium] stephanolepidis TaxID=1520670 RepID=A0A1Z4F0X3_9MYCO|nr:hypothetical protein [[Mycobacterium] stephanolepidis]BAX98860.1 hypothetical protein MSTE_03560 [[Mycobacterium] stephanolepidis]
MARQGKFRLNKKTIAYIAKNDKGLGKALDAVANAAAADAGATVEEYITDRQVRGIVGSKEDQAKNGSASKAFGRLGLRLR